MSDFDKIPEMTLSEFLEKYPAAPSEARPKEWFDATHDELFHDKEKQKLVFERMLRILENDGHCRSVFHKLAWALFQDEMGEY